MSRRGLAFALLCLVCAVVAVAAVGSAARRTQEQDRKAEQAAAVVRPTVARLLDDGQPFVLFRSLDRNDGSTYGRLALAPLDGGAAGDRLLAGEKCERVDLAAGHGLCLGTPDPVGFSAKILDATLTKTGSVRLPGVPSRTRVSPDGHYGAVTSFVAGHSYADVGHFSTAATIIDLGRGRKVADLEKDFTIMLDGKRATAVDRNFWGVTFSKDGDTFYATMATGGHTYLIKASLRKRTGTAIHDERRVPGAVAGRDADRLQEGGRSRPADLALPRARPRHRARDGARRDASRWTTRSSGWTTTPCCTRSGESTWTVPADGSGTPRRWLAAGDSPAIVRTTAAR